MIFKSLKILENELNTYFKGFEDPALTCLIENFATKAEDEEVKDKIIATLVRIEEETTLKNMPNNKIVGNTSLKSNPIIHLNLYVLFVSNYGQNYEKSLKGLSEVIKFFQGKYHFNAQNSNTNGLVLKGDFKLWANIHTPTFEEANHIWSMFGGKQYPSVLFKVKMIAEERTAVQSESALITNIGGEINKI